MNNFKIFLSLRPFANNAEKMIALFNETTTCNSFKFTRNVFSFLLDLLLDSKHLLNSISGQNYSLNSLISGIFAVLDEI